MVTCWEEELIDARRSSVIEIQVFFGPQKPNKEERIWRASQEEEQRD